MTTISDLIEFAEQRGIPYDAPLQVYVAVEDAHNSEAYADQINDDHGALWSATPLYDEDGLCLTLLDIQERAERR